MPEERSKVRISKQNVSLTVCSLPDQVCMGEKRRAIVGEWKPGTKRRSWMFLIVVDTSERERTNEGE